MKECFNQNKSTTISQDHPLPPIFCLILTGSPSRISYFNDLISSTGVPNVKYFMGRIPYWNTVFKYIDGYFISNIKVWKGK